MYSVLKLGSPHGAGSPNPSTTDEHTRPCGNLKVAQEGMRSIGIHWFSIITVNIQLAIPELCSNFKENIKWISNHIRALPRGDNG